MRQSRDYSSSSGCESFFSPKGQWPTCSGLKIKFDPSLDRSWYELFKIKKVMWAGRSATKIDSSSVHNKEVHGTRLNYFMGRLGRPTCAVHLISGADQARRKRMYHYTRTATGMDGTLPHCNFENLKPVEISKNCFNIIWTSLKVVKIFKIRRVWLKH